MSFHKLKKLFSQNILKVFFFRVNFINSLEKSFVCPVIFQTFYEHTVKQSNQKIDFFSQKKLLFFSYFFVRMQSESNESHFKLDLRNDSYFTNEAQTSLCKSKKEIRVKFFSTQYASVCPTKQLEGVGVGGSTVHDFKY